MGLGLLPDKVYYSFQFDARDSPCFGVRFTVTKLTRDGSGEDNDTEYVIVWFIGDEVEGVTQYHQEIPDDERCGWFFKEVDWAQAPDAVKTELYIE